jgi:hypothetical protein
MKLDQLDLALKFRTDEPPGMIEIEEQARSRILAPRSSASAPGRHRDNLLLREPDPLHRFENAVGQVSPDQRMSTPMVIIYGHR